MRKVNADFLSVLKHRFDEQITESDILKWLYNFEDTDWESALTLLNKVCYYSENRCVKNLETGLNSIITSHRELPIAFF